VNRLRAAVALTLLPIMAGGCVAAAIPVVAGGLIARDKLPGGKRAEAQRGRSNQREMETRLPSKVEVGQVAVTAIDGREVLQTGLKALPTPNSPAPDGRATGTGEAAAYSLQAYQALWNHLTTQAERRRGGGALQSVILAPGATLDAPGYAACGSKPLAVVFDLDESADKAADPDAQWRLWKGDGTDAVVATPGAVEGIEAARREGIVVIFTTRRSPASAPGVVSVLDRLGFGRFEPGRTLMFGSGTETQREGEQVRQVIAAGYCVIALVGDSLNDFSKLFEAAGDSTKRQTAATETMVAPLWGAGWFILPNPVRSVATTPNQ
jgi:HAD superfamily, subfamily IIIB (Acid phosphatase)